MLQYGVNKGEKHSDVDYDNVKGVILIVLMKESPKLLKEYNSPRYIHRKMNDIFDTGLCIPSACTVTYVQLDKALDAFKSNTYEADEDIELLHWLAMIADVNDQDVIKTVKGNPELEAIRNELKVFSSNKEVQQMILSEMLAELDYNTSIHDAENRGKEIGMEIGEEIGKEKLLLEMVSEGAVTEEYAAKKLNISLEEFRSICKK